MNSARLRYRLLALGLGSAISLSVVSGAQGDRGRYVARSFTESATTGLMASPPLEEFRAVSRGRVVVPAEWRRLKAKPGQQRFLTPGRGCRYRVIFAVRSRLSQPRDAAEYVAAALPSGQGRLLEEGQRGNRAFRVMRAPAPGSTVRLEGFWAGVLTRRSDIAPTGQVAWSEISVTATSRPGDECHSGSWRERLGPQLGDALATARARLRFVPAPK